MSYVLSNSATLILDDTLEKMDEWGSMYEKGPFEMLASFFQKMPKRYLDQIALLSQSISSMKKTNLATICINIVAVDNQESESIIATLKELENQISYKSMEVICFCNWPSTKKPDKTAALIREYSMTSKLTIHVLEMATLSHISNSISCSFLMHAVVLWRTFDKRISEVIHITLRSDITNIARTFVGSYIKALKPYDSSVAIGEVNWDNKKISTSSIPELLIGNELMYLLPRYGTWQILEDYMNQKASSKKNVQFSEELLEAVFCKRSFNNKNGLLANVAWKGTTYARVGGYHPLVDDGLAFVLHKIFLVVDFYNIKFLCYEVSISLDSRRALWAFYSKNRALVHQSEFIPLVPKISILNSLPELEISDKIDIINIQHHINATLKVFNLPKSFLIRAVTSSLAEIGLELSSYKLTISEYIDDPVLSMASIEILNPYGLIQFIKFRMDKKIGY